VTLRSFVQPVDTQGTWLVSGMSFDGSGPFAASRSRTSRRNRSLSASHRRYCSPLGHIAIVARYSRRSAIGRTIALNSHSVRSVSSARRRSSGR
jgi:hypothetical protein